MDFQSGTAKDLGKFTDSPRLPYIDQDESVDPFQLHILDFHDVVHVNHRLDEEIP